MVLSKGNPQNSYIINTSHLTAAQKRRVRRRKLNASRVNNTYSSDLETCIVTVPNKAKLSPEHSRKFVVKQTNIKEVCLNIKETMSSKEDSQSREQVLATREAKKLAKQKVKSKVVAVQETNTDMKHQIESSKEMVKENSTKSKDEVDRAAVKEERSVAKDEKSKEEILAERAAKKAAKQAKKKGLESGDTPKAESGDTPKLDMTVQDVVETLKEIKLVAKDVQDITAKVSAIHLEAKKVPDFIKTSEESGRSKAELKAERRAKQEAQRAAKQVAIDPKTTVKPKPETAKPEVAIKADAGIVKEKSPKPKSADKSKPKSISSNRVNWFQHLYTEHDKEALKNITINSNLHPAIIKLGVQLASHVVTGSNARCIALLDALKKMVKDYTLPAKTEFARGLESHLAASLDFLWAMRQPSASQTNAVKYFRHHLTQLPNNVDEFDAKKTLQEEIDKYIEDQIDKAGEAISMAVRNKISEGDNILTYGCSSLIERILREAWEAKVKFRTVVVGSRQQPRAREMLRRLAAGGLACTYVDITGISYVMKTINKVLLGAGALLVNGSVLGAVGTAQTALVARSFNVPVLVACETHKFSQRVQTDAFVYNELGNPDDLIDKTDDNSPLKDWRSNPNLTPLNLTYDVTPPSLVTAVVTEKAILPCTSAPVVLRTKLSEFGI